MLTDCDERLVKAISGKVKEYNQLTSTLDFTRPSELNIYCILQGCCFTITQEDTWLEEMDIPLCEEKLEELLDSCSDNLEDISEEEKSKKEELKNCLKEYLLADSQFLQ